MRHSLRTKITDLLGIERPIIQGGMHFVGQAALAAAVSDAGGMTDGPSLVEILVLR
jgi:NAD(P)H-dependent flavin oxidoreductase YrpB (nitropropane dioxygenase family)